MFKYFGSKSYLLKQLYAYFPRSYSVFVDALAGSGKVLLNSPRIALTEVINELNSDIVTTFRIVQTRGAELRRHLCQIEFGKETFLSAFECDSADEMKTAIRTVVKYGQSRNGGGTPDFSYSVKGLRTLDYQRQWCATIRKLAGYSFRLRGVIIECGDWSNTLRYDSPDTFYYFDPPYLSSTRVFREYVHEFTNEQHIEMCKRLTSVKGKVMLSGYGNPIYRHYLRGWREVLLDSYNRSSHAKKLKKSDERIWMNY